MATNNLTDFLTQVAGAIREKDGTTEEINPQDFVEKILALPSVSALPQVGELRIFYDNTKPASIWGGTWSEAEFANGTFLMAAGSGGEAGQTGGSNTHNHKVTLKYNAFWNDISGDDKEIILIKDNSNSKIPYSSASQIPGTTTQRVNNGVQPAYREEEDIVSYESTGATTTADNRPAYRTVHIWRRVS